MLTRTGVCSTCRSSATIRRSNDEFTTKVVEDNDLIKGF